MFTPCRSMPEKGDSGGDREGGWEKPMGEAPETYLGWQDVKPLFGGISRTTAWRGVRDGWLPRPGR